MGPPDKGEGEKFQADGGFLMLLLLLLGVFIGDESYRWLCGGWEELILAFLEVV